MSRWADTAISAVVPGYGHDINNLLTAILSKAGIILGRTSTGTPFLEAARGIETCALQARQLTGLLLSLFEEHPRDLQTSPTQPDEELHALEPLFRAILPHSVRLCLDLDAPGAIVNTRDIEFRRVVMNLAMNAARALENGGELRFSTRIHTTNSRQSNDAFCFVLMVADTGAGMDDATKAGVETFCSRPNNHDAGNTGLKFVSEIVHAAGGRIRFRSRLGHGTSFEIRIPCLCQLRFPFSRQGQTPTGDLDSKLARK